MKIAASLFCLLGLVPLLTPHASAANLFINDSFEDPLTSDGAPFVGFWETFSGSAAASATASADLPRTGALSLLVEIMGEANTFAGVFQDVEGLNPGDVTLFSGWHWVDPAPAGVGLELRIEWRDSVSNTEIARTPNFVPNPGSTYEPFSIEATVPAGADSARVVYAAQSFGGLTEGKVYVDDVSFEVVPEPSSTLLLMLGSAGILIRRRR